MNKTIIKNILKAATKIAIKRNHYRIVAITGSAGKTSTKKAITLVLKTKYRVLSFENEGYNTELGLPLLFIEKKIPTSKIGWLVLALKSPFLAYKKRDYDYCVLEMAADKPGDIEYFTDFINPNIAVITNVFPVHLEKFMTVEKIAAEKAKILINLRTNDVAILNKDDELVAKMFIPQGAEKITFGKQGEIKTVKQEISHSGSHNFFDIENQQIEIKSSALGEQMMGVFGAAIAVGLKENIEIQKIKEALEGFTPVPGRLNLISGVKDSLIIDDSYNANPASMKVALKVLDSIPAKRKIAVLGNMNELGSMEKTGHLEIGGVTSKTCDILVTVGEKAENFLAAEARKAMIPENIHCFKTSNEAGIFLKDFIEENDVILFKGSQNGVWLEKAVKIIMAEPEKSSSLLCRQGKEWA